MGTSTVALAIAAALAVLFALVAFLVVRARNRAELRTQSVLWRISQGMESISTELGRASAGLRPDLGGEVALPMTLDLADGLRRVASVAAALPGMTGGAARVDLLDGSAVVNAVGILSGATGLETTIEPPDQSDWRTATVTWRHAPGVGGAGQIQTGVIAPVVAGRQRIGLIGAYTTAPEIAPDIVEAVAALASSAAPGLAAAREHEALKELVRTDPLTGMLNRRGLDEDLSREVARAIRTGAPLSILMLDLDHFSRANKVTHAHGDEVLREFSRVVREACRESDIPCRRGGEEFTVILPDTTCAAALRVDARIRALVTATDFPHLGRLTYSSGITMLRDADDAAELDRRASELVNHVKANGRDNVAHDCAELTPPSGPPAGP